MAAIPRKDWPEEKRSEDNRMEVSEAGLVISYRYCSNTWASHNLSNFSSSYTMSATIKHIWKYLTDLLKGTYLSNFLFSHIGLYQLIKDPGCWVSLKTIILWFLYTADKTVLLILFSLFCFLYVVDSHFVVLLLCSSNYLLIVFPLCGG